MKVPRRAAVARHRRKYRRGLAPGYPQVVQIKQGDIDTLIARGAAELKKRKKWLGAEQLRIRPFRKVRTGQPRSGDPIYAYQATLPTSVLVDGATTYFVSLVTAAASKTAAR